jgi:hypothetical protein
VAEHERAAVQLADPAVRGGRRAASGALTALVCLSLGGCARPCGIDIVEELTSPDGNQKAVLFTRNCGATTDYTSEISILPLHESPSDGGNVFAADSNHGAASTLEGGGPIVVMSWTSPNALSVSYAAEARAFAKENKVRGVEITYLVGDAP